MWFIITWSKLWSSELYLLDPHSSALRLVSSVWVQKTTQTTEQKWQTLPCAMCFYRSACGRAGHSNIHLAFEQTSANSHQTWTRGRDRRTSTDIAHYLAPFSLISWTQTLQSHLSKLRHNTYTVKEESRWTFSACYQTDQSEQEAVPPLSSSDHSHLWFKPNPRQHQQLN